MEISNKGMRRYMNDQWVVYDGNIFCWWFLVFGVPSFSTNGSLFGCVFISMIILVTHSASVFLFSRHLLKSSVEHFNGPVLLWCFCIQSRSTECGLARPCTQDGWLKNCSSTSWSKHSCRILSLPLPWRFDAGSFGCLNFFWVII